MASLSIWHWIIVLAVVLLAASGFRKVDAVRGQRVRTPVYSAETTLGKEAEFIRDQRTKRISPAIVFLAGAAFCAVVWWITR